MLPVLVFLPFVAAALIAGIRLPALAAYRWVALVFTAGALGLLATMSVGWSQDAPIVFSLPWMPAVGLHFSVWLDGPALFWAWLVLGIGFLVIWYAGYYMKPNDAPRRFYASLMLFLGAMLGLVLSRNVLLMFVFWELTSISSFLLISHWHHKKSAVAGAKRALLVTGLGGLSLMAGIAVVGVVLAAAGVPNYFEWDVLRSPEALAALQGHPATPVALLLMLGGVFTKSAQFPFHFWLPAAMEAPTPVSALLHAATMVKAGIYLLGRIYPMFHDEFLWLLLVGGIGVVTMMVGGYLALLAKDLKQLLAFSTVSQLGLLTAYYGFGYNKVGGDDLLALDLLLVASHALFKAGLFMLCGVIDHEAGTRDWTRMGGLVRKMPATAFLTVIGCLSMAGMPFTLGFVAKKLFLDAGVKLATPELYLEDGLLLLAILASVLTMAYSIRLSWSPFFGKPRDEAVYKKAHEGGWLFLSAPAFLILLCLLGGLYVPIVETPLSRLVDTQYFYTGTKYSVAMFKSADFLFWVSLGIYAVGGPLVFLASGWFMRLNERLHEPMPFLRLSDRLFDEWIPGLALWTRQATQAPSLARNAAIVSGFVALAAAAAFGALPQAIPPLVLDPSLPGLAAMALLVVCAAGVAAVVLLKGALVRVMALGIVGLTVGAFFLLFRAPDLAITQVLVELVLLLMLLVLVQRLGAPPATRLSGPMKATAPVVAAVTGIVMGVLVYTSATVPTPGANPGTDALSHRDFFLTHTKYPAAPGAHSGGGTNAVNVILVDFRALDTLGEITVLVVAALGAAALLVGASGSSRLARPRQGIEKPFAIAGVCTNEGPPLVLRLITPTVAFLSAAYAGVLFLAGHNLPGGGFIAGLLASVALLAGPILLGWRQASPPSWLHPGPTMGLGLLFAVGVGLVPLLFGLAFLRTGYTYIQIPLLGEIEVASALVFDLGVFLVVVGISLLIVRSFTRTAPSP